MLHTTQATRGMTVAPHALAAEAGVAVLRDGGNAVEAAVAMAAALAALYPHMTGLGGDSFWLLAGPGEPVTAVDGSGACALGLDPVAWRERFTVMPHRGPEAANTVAGAVSGWQAALNHSRRHWGGGMPLTRVLEDAIDYARGGAVVSASQARALANKGDELLRQPGFAASFGSSHAGSLQHQPALARTLERLAQAGLEDFYRGELATAMASELASLGSPLRRDDFARHGAVVGEPLALPLDGRLGRGTLFANPPPSQGLVTLLILGQYDAAPVGFAPESDGWIHFLVEASKWAFTIRDAHIGDPRSGSPPAADTWLQRESLRRHAAAIDPERASPWPRSLEPGDTTWFGAIDGQGRAVSCIQSLYHEFGSGVVLRDTGICWQNRGASFRLEPGLPRSLASGRRPFHTLCPSLARMEDGRTLVLGTMGGDGQPQTQAALLSRYLDFAMPLQAAVTAPRWVLGRTWGAGSDTLKLEARFATEVEQALRRRGHAVERVAAFDEMMGHAGALVRHDGGLLEGAADPRSDGAVAAF